MNHEEEDIVYSSKHFNRKILLNYDLGKLDRTQLLELVEKRISELNLRLGKLELIGKIQALSEEEYHIRYLDILNELSHEPEYSNGYSNLVLKFIQAEKTKYIDQLILLSPNDVATKQIASNEYAEINNLEIMNGASLIDDFNDLLDRLVKDKFISLETKKRDFQKVFTKSTNINKVVWLGSQMELHYFISNIRPCLLHKAEPFKRAQSIFLNKSGSHFKNLNNPNSKIKSNRLSKLQTYISYFLNSFESIRTSKLGNS